MAKVIGIHQLDLKPGVTDAQAQEAAEGHHLGRSGVPGRRRRDLSAPGRSSPASHARQYASTAE